MSGQLEIQHAEFTGAATAKCRDKSLAPLSMPGLAPHHHHHHKPWAPTVLTNGPFLLPRGTDIVKLEVSHRVLPFLLFLSPVLADTPPFLFSQPSYPSF